MLLQCALNGVSWVKTLLFTLCICVMKMRLKTLGCIDVLEEIQTDVTVPSSARRYL